MLICHFLVLEMVPAVILFFVCNIPTSTMPYICDQNEMAHAVLTGSQIVLTRSKSDASNSVIIYQKVTHCKTFGKS